MPAQHDQQKRALIAMSGGVDSSVAAVLMQRAGYRCTGATMKLLVVEQDAPLASRLSPAQSSCCSLEDCEDARAVCALLKIPYYVFDFTAEFRRDVIERFIAAYRQGRTPNPCIDCNRYLKFERLLARALVTGHHCLATGHYARISYDGASKRWQLQKALDASKDQSYVLYALTQQQLACTRLPLGDLSKAEVRELARELGLRTAEKPESQDICFVADGDYASWIAEREPAAVRPGDILSEDGQRLGSHDGIIHYTIGQRRRLGIASGEPYYVKRIDAATASITVSRQSGLYQSRVRLRDINLIAVARLEGRVRLSARHRYHCTEVTVEVEQSGPDELTVAFTEPVKALTPGQALVLYNGDFVFGGGTIVTVD
ncbi:MAG: tRNA 2-thiouridine(34) synthase MnmA [Coriobacteriales bacterium]|jgi:tRNA-specific 2-thiouridylase|nr:tRNA 2-thiouridine(34) synthase MnmA [Coriobacteriales bacterium]